MTIIANEFTSAGIGADIRIKGLDDLYRANDLFTKLNETSQKFQHAIDAKVNINVNGMDKLKEVERITDKLRRPVDTKVNINTEDFNKINQNVTEMNKKMSSLGSDIATHMKKPLHDTGEETENTSHKVHHLRDAFAGGFLGGMIGNAVGNVTTQVGSLTKQAYNAAKGAAGLNKQWQNIGIGEKGATELMGQVSQIRGVSDMAAGSINQMQRNFYALTGNVGQTKQFTEAITAFGKAGGATTEQMERQSKMIPQMLAQRQNSGVNGGMFNRMFGRLPELKNAIQQYSGMSKKAFSDALQNGKITGSQLEKYLGNASKHSGEAWKQFNSTMGGQMAALKGTWANAVSSFGKPFFSAITGAFGTINKNGKVVGEVRNQVMGLSQSIGTTLGNTLGKLLKWLAENRNSLMSLGKSISSIIKALGSGAIATITTPFKLLTGHANKASQGVSGVAKAFGDIAKYQKTLKTIGGIVVSLFAAKKAFNFARGVYHVAEGLHTFYSVIKSLSIATKIINGISIAFKALSLTNPFGWIVLGVTAAVAALWSLWHWRKPIINFFKGIGSWASKEFGKLMKWAKKVGSAIPQEFNKLKTKLTKVGGNIGSALTRKFGKTGKDLVKSFKDAFRLIKDVLIGFKDFFTGNWGAFFKHDIPKIFGDLSKLLKDELKTLWDAITSLVKRAGHSLWQGIKNQASGGINGVIKIINAGISGIDWVMNKLGGKKQTIAPMNMVHLAKGTERRPIDRNTLAMMNDGHDSPETHNRELAVLPNGRMFMPKQANWKGMLPAGTHVFSAKETRELMGMRGIRHFSLGTGIKHAWDWTKGKAESIGSVLMHPMKYFNNIFHLNKLQGVFGSFLGGMFGKVKDKAKSFFNDLISNMGNPKGAGTDKWKPIIERAASMMNVGHLAGSDMDKILGSISRESGGNAGAHQQVSDINSANGNPAQGLLQFIPQTFEKYAVSGHKNMMNGLDQIMAMFNDSSWRSDMHSGAGGWGPTGIPKREHGGRINANQLSLVGEKGAELFKPDQAGTVIPHQQTKRIMNHNDGNKNIKVDSHPKFVIQRDMSDDDIHSMFDSYHDSLIDHLNNADV